MKFVLTYLKNLFIAQKDKLDRIQFQGIEKTDYLLNSLIKEEKTPGLAITVLNKGELFFQKGYGYADLNDKKK